MEKLSRIILPHLLVFLPLLWIPLGYWLGFLAKSDRWMNGREFSYLLMGMMVAGAAYSIYRIWKIEGKERILTALVYFGVFFPLQIVAIFLVSFTVFGK